MRTLPRVRAIEYEILSLDRAATVTGLPPKELEWCMGDVGTIAVVKCANERGVRLTALGNPRSLHELLASDEQDIVLATSHWPIILRGWLSHSHVSSGLTASFLSPVRTGS